MSHFFLCSTLTSDTLYCAETRGQLLSLRRRMCDSQPETFRRRHPASSAQALNRLAGFWRKRGLSFKLRVGFFFVSALPGPGSVSAGRPAAEEGDGRGVEADPGSVRRDSRQEEWRRINVCLSGTKVSKFVELG